VTRTLDSRNECIEAEALPESASGKGDAMGSVRAWRALSFVLLVVLVGAVARSTLAAPTTHQGTSLKKVKVVTETFPNSINTDMVTSADLPGATTSISVPDGTQALLLIRFTAESSCFGRVPGWCSLKFLVNAEEADPVAGDSYAFDSVNREGSQDYEGHAAERVAGPLGPGTYAVKVQRRIVKTANPLAGKSVFRLDDWTLTVERIEV
jgi:hypothetical protein